MEVTIRRSSPVLDIMPNPADGSLDMRVHRLAGHGNVVIYTSTNLVHWTPVWTNAPGRSEMRFNESAHRDQSTRFYRVEER
jgi:hypothetical protein